MNCQICNKNREWFIKVVRYPPDGTYKPVNFEWCIACAYKELKTVYDNQQQQQQQQQEEGEEEEKNNS